VVLVQALQEQQIGDLFDDFQRVRDTAAPERIPDLVYLGLDFTVITRASLVSCLGQKNPMGILGTLVPKVACWPTVDALRIGQPLLTGTFVPEEGLQ
jgi:hypothetical protein